MSFAIRPIVIIGKELNHFSKHVGCGSNQRIKIYPFDSRYHFLQPVCSRVTRSKAVKSCPTDSLSIPRDIPDKSLYNHSLIQS